MNDSQTPKSEATLFEVMFWKIRGAMVESDLKFEKNGGSTSDYLRLFMRELSERGLAILPEPASDPSPDLRERLENAVRDNLLSTTPYFELAITKITDAVLSTLGETT